MTDWTPGPWAWDWRLDDNGETQCGVYHEKHPGHAVAVARCPRYQTEEQWKADAPLIAAAAALYEALDGLAADYNRQIGSGSKALAKADAALARARGETE